jgi:hypothetical protein
MLQLLCIFIHNHYATSHFTATVPSKMLVNKRDDYELSNVNSMTKKKCHIYDRATEDDT